MNKIMDLRKNSGTKFTVQYLKLANLLTIHYLSGNPRTSGPEIRVATSFGLPLIIPKSLRDLISSGDRVVIRVVLAILSVFRVMSYKGSLKLSTITSPFTGVSTTVSGLEVRRVWDRLFESRRGYTPPGPKFLLNLKTAGPNYRVSILGATLDAYEHMRQGWSRKPIQVLSDYFGSRISTLLDDEISLIKDLVPTKVTKLGKLSTKTEPAGKIRVFAITDVWTQTILLPVHEHVFKILKGIVQDGTFDQDAPLSLLRARVKEKEDKSVFSYDLSAATDRFPVDFQVQLLSMLYNRDVADA
jgi:hypothetical protein